MKINNEFFIKYKDYINSVLHDKGYNDPDMTQDVFEAAMLYVDYFNNDFKGSVTNWINQLVIYVVDRKKRSNDMMNTDTYEIDFTDDSTEAVMVTAEDLLDSTSNFYYDNKEIIDKYIGMLPPKQHTVVHNKLVLGFTHQEIADKMRTSESASKTNYKLGIANLKKLIDSDCPEKEVLKEAKILKPYSGATYSGNWAWRPSEGPDRSPSKVKHYSPDEIIAYCQENNLNYNLT